MGSTVGVKKEEKLVKIILSIIGCLFLIMLFCMLVMVGIVTVVNRPRGDREEVLSGKGANPKKALIIYQPALTNVTRQAAKQLADGLNAGGYEVTLNHPGNHLTVDLSGYDLVVFGSPTYAGQLTKALTQYMARGCPQLAKEGAEGPRVVLFATGGVDERQEFDRLAELLSGGKVVREVKFLTGDKEYAAKAYALGAELAQE